MLEKLRYGTEKQTTYIDEQGSTKSVERKYKAGNLVGAVVKEYRIRERVHNRKEEMAHIIRFIDELTEDKEEPQIHFEHTELGKKQGYWYVVKCYKTVHDTDK